MKKLSKYALKQLTEDERVIYDMQLWIDEHQFIEVCGGEITITEDDGVAYFTVWSELGDRLYDAYAYNIDEAEEELWNCKKYLYDYEGEQEEED